ncbi:hypothetical protein DPMN_131361 [Dreissena polymorpha]|uniref:Uncharacterized protein n=1 Tax=Dreissena polymorpha TaxID=45954 RepID=A0A9D4H8A8_DREPO|nr:hypothetical protein DPMN_131361 [Dreissena polymorpha]
MYVRAAFARKAAVVQVSWLGSVREGRLSAAGDKRPIEPCRHAASRVHASAETATRCGLETDGPAAKASATRQTPASWCPSPRLRRDCEDTDRAGVRLADPRTGEAPADSRAAMCVQDVDVQCVLQFTLIHAAGCALHRRTSRVIQPQRVVFVCTLTGRLAAAVRQPEARASTPCRA